MPCLADTNVKQVQTIGFTDSQRYTWTIITKNFQ